MKKIDTTYWKEFRIGELFEKLDLRFKKKIFNKTTDVSLVETPEYNLPLVNAKHFNNGIMYYGRESDFESAEMTIDIVANGAASTGDVYPQPQRTGVLIDAYLIRPKKKDISIYMLYYLATIIQRCIKEKYSYDDKCVWNKVKNEYILLPAKDDAPDWQYMEDYMRGVEQKTKSAITALKKAKNACLKIDHSYWKEFKIGDLFEKLELPFLKKKFNKAYDVSLDRTEEFSLPLVNAKHSNNGIMYYGRESDFASAEMTIDIVADGAASTGDVYPQPQRTGVLYNAYLVKLKNKTKESKWVLFFLSSVIEKSVKQKYGYDNKCTWDKVSSEYIKLPSTPSGEPDWHYMEMYMRGVEAIVRNKLSLLVPHKPEIALHDAATVNFNNANVTYIDNSKTFNVEK